MESYDDDVEVDADPFDDEDEPEYDSDEENSGENEPDGDNSADDNDPIPTSKSTRSRRLKPARKSRGDEDVYDYEFANDEFQEENGGADPSAPQASPPIAGRAPTDPRLAARARKGAGSFPENAAHPRQADGKGEDDDEDFDFDLFGRPTARGGVVEEGSMGGGTSVGMTKRPSQVASNAVGGGSAVEVSRETARKRKRRSGSMYQQVSRVMVGGLELG